MKYILLSNIEDYIVSILEFLSSTESLIIFSFIIIVYVWYRFFGLKEQIEESKKRKQEENERYQEKLNSYKEIHKNKDYTKTESFDTSENSNEPKVVYKIIERESTSNSSFGMIFLEICLIISIVLNILQYRELEQYREIFGEIKNTLSIFQELLK